MNKTSTSGHPQSGHVLSEPYLLPLQEQMVCCSGSTLLFLRVGTQLCPSHSPTARGTLVCILKTCICPKPQLALLTQFFNISAFSLPANSFPTGGRELLLSASSVSKCALMICLCKKMALERHRLTE